MSAIHRHEPELFDFTAAREEPLESAGPDDLESCHTCHGEGAMCPDCKGDGTQIRADLELMARAMSLPSEREEAA